MERVLIVASVASMIDQFNIPNIKLLKSMGYKVDVACNFKEGSSCSQDKICELLELLTEMDVNCYQIDFSRSITNLYQNLKALWQIEKILKKTDYKFVHCHSPIGGVISRIACHKSKIPCIYTAHGFHFFKGAPIKNWLLFYPIEKYFSKYTDILITINKEDYNNAKKHFYMKELELIPGVGIDTNKFSNIENFNRKEYRKGLGLSDDNIMLFSVGELNKNKNHEVVIRALEQINNKNVHYFIAGQGNLKDYLLELAKKLNVEDQVHLLGFRNDIRELNHCADIFMFPSLREGLGLAAIEAMASGLPLVTSNKHGINDYSENGVTGYKISPNDVNGFAEAINEIISDSNCDKLSKHNIELSKKYDLKNVDECMKIIYEEI